MKQHNPQACGGGKRQQQQATQSVIKRVVITARCFAAGSAHATSCATASAAAVFGTRLSQRRQHAHRSAGKRASVRATAQAIARRGAAAPQRRLAHLVFHAPHGIVSGTRELAEVTHVA